MITIFNSTLDIGQVLSGTTTNVTGSLDVTLVMVVVLMLMIATLFRSPMILILLLLIPMIVVFSIYQGAGGLEVAQTTFKNYTQEVENNLDENIAKYDAEYKNKNITQEERDKAFQNKTAEEDKKRREEQLAAEQAARVTSLNDQIAGIELRRLAAEQAGEDTLKFDQALILKRTQLELTAEGLTENQKKLIREKGAAAMIQLTKDTTKVQSDIALQGLISQNNAQLAQLNLSAEERLSLTEANIITAAQLEINAAEGNAARIKEIEAKRNADIKAARLKSIQETLNYELALREAENGAGGRALQRVAADEKAALSVRIAAIDELLAYEIATGDKKLAALNKELAQGLISYKDYNLQYENLIDDQVKAVEDAEQKKQDLIEKTAKKQLEEATKVVNNTIQTAQAVAGVLDALSQ